ncbi:hypothetical protein B0T22DRAFT_19947 [Podospora appendiculata]|uniref:Uncharacterized protein n=1 Tax=Podospora appendiculata TaxID=314037 RepID=A0AAE1CFI5_9PEZI|nr:hypothetical protein B0T22DRAFT_19947 [Podospora appendiculata]
MDGWKVRGGEITCSCFFLFHLYLLFLFSFPFFFFLALLVIECLGCVWVGGGGLGGVFLWGNGGRRLF